MYSNSRSSNSQVTVSLVLGSGGARGMAHIGIINWLTKHDYKIKSISGCSIGALVGGVFAAGKLDEFEKWVRALNTLEIVALFDLSWRKGGLLKGDKVINSLIELVGDVKIEELPIKYTAVAADILNEKEIWMNEGRLFDAVRASISLPLFFTPFKHQGIDLIDGGVLNPVPIAPTFGDQTDVTIAVNLGGKPEQRQRPKSSTEKASKERTILSDKIVDFLEAMTDSGEKTNDTNWSSYEVANLAFDAMQSTLARQKLAAYPPDYSIEIARNACGILEFEKADEMIDLGYDKAQKALCTLSEN